MPKMAAFGAGEDSLFRLRQVDGETNIIREESEAGSLRKGDMFQHGHFLHATFLATHGDNTGFLRRHSLPTKDVCEHQWGHDRGVGLDDEFRSIHTELSPRDLFIRDRSGI